jgi:hypothetical protein
MLSTEELESFKIRLLSHANVCVKRIAYCTTEEATKQSLVLPFIALLGYDIFNTQEVIPEHNADFSDKYKNRVDYAITKNEKPSIAIECKKVGAQLDKADRGQLRSYFNACESVKLGVLTDGIRYEFFADCDAPNMMDETPFIKFSLEEIQNTGINDEQLQAIACFIKSEFNPENIGAEAKRKLVSASMVSFFEKNYKDPSDEFIKFVLSSIPVGETRITKNTIKDSRLLLMGAISSFIDKEILARVGLSVNTTEVAASEESGPVMTNDLHYNEIITTANEINVYNYTMQRLAFLVDSEELYDNLKYISYQDYKTTFVVYYKKKVDGRLFNLEELSDGRFRFFFSAIDKEIITNNLSDIDDALLLSYKIRMAPPVAKTGIPAQEKDRIETSFSAAEDNADHSA